VASAELTAFQRSEPIRCAEAAFLGLDRLRTELEVPEQLQAPPGVVVIEADERDSRGLVRCAGIGRLDEPLPVACADDLPCARKTVLVIYGWWRNRMGGIDACRYEQGLDELVPSGGAGGQPMSPARCCELFTPELLQHGGEPAFELSAERLRELLLGGGGAPQSNAEDAREVEDALLRERAERRGGRECGGHLAGRRGHRVRYWLLHNTPNSKASGTLSR
jgi:hypothetical protein